MRAASRRLGLGVCLLSLWRCGGDAQLEACDIAQRSCQEDVFYAVLRLRGDGWDPFGGLPPIRTISLEQYRDELLASRPRPQPDPDVEPAAAKPDPWSAALQILGLITPAVSAAQAAVDSQVDNVAAFYAPSTRKVTVIARGQRRNDASDTTLLAHELVHAFQDRELSGGLNGSDTDGGFAGRAFVEGEAVLYEHLIAQELAQRHLSGQEWLTFYDRWLRGLRKNMPGQRSPFFAAPWFVYPLGGSLMTAEWVKGGNAAVRRLAKDYPRYSVGYMTAASGDAAAGLRPMPDCQYEPAFERYRWIAADRFGAIQFYGFLARAGLDEAAAWDLALKWNDDRLGVYFDLASAHTLVVWRIGLDDSGTAADAAARLAAMSPLVITAHGEVLEIAGSDQPGGLTSSDAPASCP